MQDSIFLLLKHMLFYVIVIFQAHIEILSFDVSLGYVITKHMQKKVA